MADQETEDIPRAAERIDKTPFKKLYKLMREHTWLERKTEAVLQLWNMPGSVSGQDLLIDLLSRFTFVGSAELEELGEKIAAHIVNQWGATPDSTYIVAISDKPEADGSQAFIQSIKNKFAEYDGWGEGNFVNSIPRSLSKVSNGTTIIFADDFVGTGRTVERKITWYRQELQNRNLADVALHLTTIACMEFSKAKLDALGIEYYSPIELKKGITEVLTGANLRKAIEDMQELESQLHPKKPRDISKYSFGYGQCEALFALEAFNVPNNVFPIYWWPSLKDKKTWTPMFRRLSP